MSNPALIRALAKFDGNQSAFAKAIGTSQQLVSYWLRNGKALPAEHVLNTEAATGISRHDLRPDLYPVPFTHRSGGSPTDKARAA